MVVAHVHGWARRLLDASIKTIVFCGLAGIGPCILPTETDGAAKARGAQPQPAKDSLGDPLPEGALLRLGTLRFRHPSSVHELALSPDEKSVVTIASQELIVWETSTGRERWRANLREAGMEISHGVAYGVQSLAFSPLDSSSFCTPGGHGEIIVWDLASGEHKSVPYQDVLPVEPATGQSAPIKALDLTSDAKKIAAGGSRGVIVWGKKGQVLLTVANKPQGPVEPGRMNNDRLWFGGHYSFGRFSPDGKMIAIVTSDAPKEIRLFDPDTGRELRRVNLKDNLVRLAFSPDSKKIVATERDVAVRLYATESGQRIWSREIKPANNAESYTCAVAYSPDGKTIAVCAPIGPDEAIYLLDSEKGDILGKLSGSTWKPWGLAFTADSKMLYSSGWDGVVRRWDVQARKQLPSPGGTRATGVCAASPDGRLLAYADDLGAIHVIDAKNGSSRRVIESTIDSSQLTFSPDSRQLAAGGTRGDEVQVVIWNLATGEVSRRWKWPKGRDPHSTVEALSYTPRGDRLAAAVFRQSAAYIWNVAGDQTMTRLPHQEVYGLSFSPDGKTLATAGWDSIIRFWDADSRKLLSENKVEAAMGPGEDLRMYAVCYAPTGRLLATAHMDCTVCIWNPDTMTMQQRIRVNGSFVFGSISFSPDGLWVATGNAGGQVSLWDPVSGSAVADVGKHQHYVYTVCFGRDARTLLTGGEGDACYLWDLRPQGALPERDTARLWDQLVGDDGAAAYRAMWNLCDMPQQAVKLLAEARDWDGLSVDRATEKQSTIARRAVSVLAQIGTPEAIGLLKKWAKGKDLLGQAAAEALMRIATS